MATISRDELFQRFSQLGIDVEKYDHAPVATVEALAKEMQALGVQGVCTKNIFLKDKKNRLYIITAAHDTSIDLKVLSSRLGLGKGGLRFAPEELLGPVLGLAPGAVTPLAVVQPSASGVVLLLDAKLQGGSQGKMLVHPLQNDSTLALESAGLDTLLRSLGRDAQYVDLEADPKIDRDNPPDLAKYIEATAAKSAEELAAAAKVDASVLASTVAGGSAAGSGGKKGGVSKKDAAGGAKQQGGKGCVMDVDSLAAALLEKISGATSADKSDPEVSRRLLADVTMQLNGLRNASFAAGFKAATGRIMGAIDNSYA